MNAKLFDPAKDSGVSGFHSTQSNGLRILSDWAGGQIPSFPEPLSAVPRNKFTVCPQSDGLHCFVRSSLQFVICISLLTVYCLLPVFSSANTYIVTTNADAGAGSLRAAITSANAAGADNIIFTIGTATITLASNLPALTDDATTIDGGGTANTNLTGGLNGTLAVTINGGSISTITAGMTISSDNNIIRGLNFINVGAAGGTDVFIDLTSGADNNRIMGCYIGTTIAGTGSSGANTEGGVRITSGANNIIGDGTAAGRNLISGLAINGTGISISGATATGNAIKGNIIGLQKDGATYLANIQQTGVVVTSSATSGTIIGGTAAGEGNVISGNRSYGIMLSYTVPGVTGANSVIGNIIGPQANGTSYVTSNSQLGGIIIYSCSNTVGGSAAGARNIISGNEAYGVAILDNAAGNVVKGNYIGLDSTGTTFITGSTQDYGVSFSSASGGGNTIGGTGTGEGNVISGNSSYGIYTNSPDVAGNSFLGNIIGPQANGTNYVVSNAQTHGIYITGSPNNTIGGSVAGSRNIISANETYGVYMTGTGTTGNSVKGNYIGPSSSLTSIAGSDQDYGVYLNSPIFNTVTRNTIGGSAAGEANTIAYNIVNGVFLTGAAADFNKISRNPIYSNGDLPIKLNPGANNDKAIPIITTATTTTVAGTSSASGDIVEVFKNTTGNCNDAVTFVGSAITDASLNWSMAVVLTTSDYILATATDASNNTSEFTTCQIPLPVELLSFSAECSPPGPSLKERGVILTWTTASETNNDYFTIERTINLQGFENLAGWEWKVVGAVQGAGNSSNFRNYEFVDTDIPSTSNPQPSTLLYYRLRQTDYDGKYEYFSPVSVQCENGNFISIESNPSGEYIHYTVGSEAGGEVTVKLYDMLGREALSKAETIEAGVTENKLSITNLSSGAYLLKITKGNFEKTQKQFVVK